MKTKSKYWIILLLFLFSFIGNGQNALTAGFPYGGLGEMSVDFWDDTLESRVSAPEDWPWQTEITFNPIGSVSHYYGIELIFQEDLILDELDDTDISADQEGVGSLTPRGGAFEYNNSTYPHWIRAVFNDATHTHSSNKITLTINGGGLITLPSSPGAYNINLNIYQVGSDYIWDEDTKEDVGALSYIVGDNNVIISATVDPTLSLDLSSNTCDFGTFDPNNYNTCGYYTTVSTNAAGGYTEYFQQDHKLKISGGHEMADVGEYGDWLAIGTETYGFVYLNDPSDTAECATYDGTSGTETVWVDPISDDEIGINTVAEPVSDSIFSYCHGLTISSTTPAGIYSQAITVTVIGNF
ncbi:MAG: hypothetical protein A2Y82_04445 [Candidatus Buchananbacteria bacterium RBG_13_36_9]|uniref:Uncharacterized protein n=1 Tax=Candidatus Buchananbacteria bacterium RBG_13_36_9 TaxID=1797530 RepID=A0A1G1XRY8_9BACT|nr:MAG: hypothetical protein A2Y82_04445 [Candidatus Buchananbacteria bacterium RBG_13_36_9]